MNAIETIDWAVTRDALLAVRGEVQTEIERLRVRLGKIAASLAGVEAQLGIVPVVIPTVTAVETVAPAHSGHAESTNGKRGKPGNGMGANRG